MSNVKKLMMSAAGGGAGAFAGVLTDNSAYQRTTFGEDVAMDSTGNYYFLSRVWTSTRYTYVTKIDSVGTILQAVRVAGVNFEGSSICIDSSDNIYVGGRGGTGSQMPMVIKWNSSFTLQWAYAYNYASSAWNLTQPGNNSATGIATDDSSIWLVGTMPVSGFGDRGFYLKAACSNGDVEYAQNFYRQSSGSQHYAHSVVVNSNYVYVGGYNPNENENFVNVFNKGNSLKKGNTDAIEIGNASASNDGYGAELTVKDDGTVYAIAGYQDTSNSRRIAAVVELNSSSSLTGNYHMYGTNNTYSSFYHGSVVHTENGDLALFGDFNDSSGSINTHKAVVMSVDDGLTSTINYADSYHLTGNYSDGSTNEVRLGLGNGGRKIIMSKDGTHIVGIGTYQSFNQSSSNTNIDHAFIFSHPVDGVGSGGAVNAGGLQVFGNINTVDSSTQPWSSSSFSLSNLTNDMAKQSESSNLTINTSYSMYNEIYTY